MNIEKLVTDFQNGDRKALARLITHADNKEFPAEIMELACVERGGAKVVGITGPPGVGKSTLIGCLIKEYRNRGQTVGVLTIDPSSVFTGGALLADRLRMGDRSQDDGVFIRSVSARGALGGVSSSAANIIKLLNAFGFNVVLVETVGAGQSDTAIMDVVHVVVVVLAPGLGDDVQMSKAGMMEIADVFVVNKADKDDANSTASALDGILISDLRLMLPAATEVCRQKYADGTPTMSDGVESQRVRRQKPIVVKTIATRGEGITDLVSRIEERFML